MNKFGSLCAALLLLVLAPPAPAQERIEGKVVGTPIRKGSETVYLPALRGKTVAVTQAMEKNERVAKAIEQLK